jgi:hypothetical protein
VRREKRIKVPYLSLSLSFLSISLTLTHSSLTSHTPTTIMKRRIHKCSSILDLLDIRKREEKRRKEKKTKEKREENKRKK